MTVTKQTLANLLRNQIGLTNQEAADLVIHFFDEIALALQTGEEVKISGFGKFSLRDKPTRPGRNPTTRQPVEISPRRVVTFRPARALRAAAQRRLRHG